MHGQPRLQRREGLLGNGNFALGAALAADVEPRVAGVGPRPAQIARDQAAQLRRAQPAVPEDAQQRVIALADLAATVRDAQQVLVVGRR